MELLHTIKEMRSWRSRQPLGARIGLVPTMGALHRGHATLAAQAVAENDRSIASIFVNPTQFGPQEDYSRYPRDLGADAALLAGLGIDAIFAPQARDIYPQQAQITYDIRDLDKRLCGASRPGHMNGVLQIVSILFHIVQPTHAYFGLKDYQQYLLIRRMATELHFPVQVVPCPIVREPDGVAMSSRNRYLDSEQRKQARFLRDVLDDLVGRRSVLQGPADIAQIVEARQAQYPAVRLDYCEVLGGRDLQPISSFNAAQAPVAFIAAYLGQTRLIDNAPLYDYPPA
ncbi:MAG: pantoate--beta-alanine ligase [Bacteroidia bacterium]